MTTNTSEQVSIILIPGHRLGAWAWDAVVEHLRATGTPILAMTLPGLDEQDPDRFSKTVDDQASAIEEAVAAAEGDVVLVAHSGANAPVSLVLDRGPHSVRRVIWVDSGPVAPGSVSAPDLPSDVHEVPLPAFDDMRERVSLDGLSTDDLARFRERAVSQPATILRARVPLANDERRRVPTTLVCCSIPSEQVMQLASAGDPMFAEVAELEHLDLVDLPTGHWPMWSRPQELAEVIHAAAVQSD